MKHKRDERKKNHQHRQRHSENEIKYAYEGNPFAKYKKIFFHNLNFFLFLINSRKKGGNALRKEINLQLREINK
jgi:hypothetical protein